MFCLCHLTVLTGMFLPSHLTVPMCVFVSVSPSAHVLVRLKPVLIYLDTCSPELESIYKDNE